MTEEPTAAVLASTDPDAPATRVAFLAEATRLLASSLDLSVTLDALARMSVPILGDVCSVLIADADGKLLRVAEASVDEQARTMLRELREHPRYRELPAPAQAAFETAQVSLIEDYRAWMRDRLASDHPYLDSIDQMAVSTALMMPLVAHGKTVGVLSLGRLTPTGRRHSAKDVELASEVAHRAAVAIEHAHLYREIEVARTHAEAERSRLYEAFMQAPVPIAMWSGSEHVFTLANAPYEKMVARSELVGKRLREAFREVAASGIFEVFDGVYATGEPFQANEFPAALDRRGDGLLEEAFFSFNLTPVRDAQRRVVGLMAVAVEVTSQVLAKRESDAARARIEESELRYRSLIDATSQVVWTTSPAGAMTSEQPRWAALTGQTPAEYRGDGWLNAIHPEDQQRTRDAWTKSVAEGTVFTSEHRVRRSDATYGLFAARGVAVVDRGGAIREWVAVHTDVTDRRKLENELAYQHKLVSTITQNATSALFLMDAERRCTFLNPAARAMIGFDEDELRGRPLHELIHHHRPDGTVYLAEDCAIERALPTRTQQHGEDAFIRKDGAFVPVAFTASPIIEANDPVGTVIEVRDITEEKRIESEREALITALRRTNEELDQFAYVASHDLKAPLRAIGSLSEWIEEDSKEVLSADARQNVKLLRGRVLRLEALIDGVLHYSRAGRIRNEAESVDTAAVVREVVELLGPGATTSVAIGELPTMLTERVPLQQIFLNLIGNALKHARHEAPRIRVSAKDAGASWCFTVEDNGPGIEPRFHERIWGIFQTLDARDRVEGTGIGLSVVKKLVESRGGRAWVTSTGTGDGASFSFTWPKRSSSSAE